jgi:hypothetical protein
MAHCKKINKIRIWEAAHLMKTWVYLGLGFLIIDFLKFEIFQILVPYKPLPSARSK